MNISSHEPTHCPSCGRDLIRPKPSTSRRALRLRLIAMITAPVGIALGWLVLEVIPGLTDLLLFVEGAAGPQRRQLAQWFAVGTVLGSPMLALLMIAGRMSRVLPFQCFSCGWEREFEIETSDDYAPEREH